MAGKQNFLASFFGGLTAAGKAVTGCSSNKGCAEDDAAAQGAVEFTHAKGHRKNKDTDELEQVIIPVCTECQKKYSPDQFPEDVKYDRGGEWDKGKK